MSKEQRPVSLIVEQTGTCPLLKAGEGFSIRGRDLSNPRGSKLCVHALCSVYPRVMEILRDLPPAGELPKNTIACDAPDCGAAFRLEEPTPADQSGLFSSPFMRRKSDKPLLPEAKPLEKPVSFMKRLTLDLHDELHFIGIEKKISDGQPVLKQDELVQSFMILTDGMAAVVVRRDGEETLVGSVAEGDFFGEYALLTATPSEHEVRSVGDGLMLSINRKEFYQLLLKRPALLQIVSKLIADKLQAAAASVEDERGRGILGKLSMIPLLDLVQTFCNSRRTGTLVIHYQTEQAFIVILKGTVSSAVAGNRRGEEAFYRVLAWHDGEFCFEPCEPFEARPERDGAIGIDTMHLMMEGMRRVDEMRATRPGPAA